MLSGGDDRETIEEALHQGAAAYISKSIDPNDLPAVLRQALEGNVYYTTTHVGRETVARVMRESEHEQIRQETGLTARELEILKAVSRGLSNREVGKELFLSDQTVKFHLNKIYRKLRVTNRTEAAKAAHKLGLVSDLSSRALNANARAGFATKICSESSAPSSRSSRGLNRAKT